MNTAQTPSPQAEAAAERFALRVTARLSSGTDELPYDITERLRAARMQALDKVYPSLFENLQVANSWKEGTSFRS